MIQKVTIKNFRALRNVAADLRPFTAFVGPNNAGKSTLLDAFRFIKELSQHGIGAYSSRGGFGDVVWNGDYKQSISIRIEGHGSTTLGFPESVLFTYWIEQTGRPDGAVVTVSERVVASLRPNLPAGAVDPVLEAPLLNAGANGVTLLEFPSENRQGTQRNLEGKNVAGCTSHHPQSCLGHSADSARHPILGHFAAAVRDLQFYDFVPSRSRGTNEARKGLDVGPEGEVLSGMLHTLQTEHPEEFREIEEVLRRGIPEIHALATALTDQGRTYATFREDNLAIKIKPWMMSNGTLRLLALLCATYSPNPPALVGVEEPEGCVHPRLAELVAHTLKRASRRSQVLVTTHSPDIVNALEPEDLLLVEKVSGATQVSRAEDKPAIREALKNLGLGEYVYFAHRGGEPS